MRPGAFLHDYMPGDEGQLLGGTWCVADWRGQSEYVAALLTGKNSLHDANADHRRVLTVCYVGPSLGSAADGAFFPMSLETAAYSFFTRWMVRQDHRSGVPGFDGFVGQSRTKVTGQSNNSRVRPWNFITTLSLTSVGFEALNNPHPAMGPRGVPAKYKKLF